MSVADLHELELVWPSLRPKDVIATGTFDQWSASIHLVKDDAGFSGTVKVPWGQKIAYKFVVDGIWRCRNDLPQEDDGHGNINNVLRTPEKPLHDPLARLSIPPAGYGDADHMVTAVEYLSPAEFTIKGPLPVPQITIEGLEQALCAGTPVTESKPNTAATEGHVYLGSEIKPAAFEQTPSSYDDSMLPTSGPVLLPSINGNGAAPGSHSIAIHVAVSQEFPNPHPATETAEGMIQEEFPLPLPNPHLMFEAVNEAVPESAGPQLSPEATQDAPALTDHVDAPPTPPPAGVSESTATQPQAGHVETAAQVIRREATSLASLGRASTSTSSNPPSSTLTRKKRRSLFARIKHIFDKDKDKQEKKERNKL